MIKVFLIALVVFSGFASPPGRATTISAGSPVTTVPTFLTDGSYLFGITVTLSADQFLLPVNVSEANGLENWQFDLHFNNTVVEAVDPLDGTSGIYGAEFTLGNPASRSFILGSFPINSAGLVDDVTGTYPKSVSGVSGDGVLAYILFQYLSGQNEEDPGFGVDGKDTGQVPEPETFLLVTLGMTILLVHPSRRMPNITIRC